LGFSIESEKALRNESKHIVVLMPIRIQR